MGRRKFLTQKEVNLLLKRDPSGATLSIVLGIGLLPPGIIFTILKLDGLFDAIGIICLVISGLLFLFGIATKITAHKRKAEHTKALLYSGIDAIDNLSPTEFEVYIARLYRLRGYRTSTTPGSSDYGIDVIAEREGEKIGIQVKKYENTVGVKAVQEVIGGLTYYGCNHGIVVTSARSFSKQAHTLASMNNIDLITYDELADLLADTKKLYDEQNQQ